MMHTLQGKRVLITQAEDFMGPALCEVFAQQGAEVIANTEALSPPGKILVIGSASALRGMKRASTRSAARGVPLGRLVGAR